LEKLAAYKKNGIKKGLKKCLRTNKRHQRINEYSYLGVAARDFFAEKGRQIFPFVYTALNGLKLQATSPQLQNLCHSHAKYQGKPLSAA
jgi:hypothetical protein